MSIPKLEDIVDRDGYLVDKTTGEKVVFYLCDPNLNTECKCPELCHYHQCDHDPEDGEGDGEIGCCSSTVDPRFQQSGTRPFYKVLKEGTYYGREYLEE